MTWQTEEQVKNRGYLTSAGGFAFTESSPSSCVLLLGVPRGTCCNALIMGIKTSGNSRDFPLHCSPFKWDRGEGASKFFNVTFVLPCTPLYPHQGICWICAGGNGWQHFGKGASQAGFASAPAKPWGGLDWFAASNATRQPDEHGDSLLPGWNAGSKWEEKPRAHGWEWSKSPWLLLGCEFTAQLRWDEGAMQGLCLVFSMQEDEWMLHWLLLPYPDIRSACAPTDRQRDDRAGNGKKWQSRGCWRGRRREVSLSWAAAPLQYCTNGIHTMQVLHYPPQLITSASAEDKTEIIFIFVLTFLLPRN